MPKGKFSPQESAYAVRAIRATLEVQEYSTSALRGLANSADDLFSVSADTQALIKAAKIEQTRRS